MSCYIVLFTLFAVLGVMSLNRNTGNKKPLSSLVTEVTLPEEAVLLTIVIKLPSSV
jgi:hypothetical protein